MNFEPRNLFITGGAGFIGSNFVHHWLANSRTGRVVVFDALTYAGNIENLADLKDDPRYATHAARGVNQTELDERIAAWTKAFSSADLLALLERHGVPCGRVYTAPDMLEDPQFAARDAIATVEHPVFGQIRMQNVFPKLSETPGEVRWPGPALGEHTDAVLGERLGLPPDRIAALKSAGVI